MEIWYNYVCYIPRKFQGQKIKTPGNFTLIFLGLPRNSTLFLINPWKFCMLFYDFMNTPGKSISSPSPIPL